MTHRIEKVGEQIRRILSEVLLKEKDTFSIGIVSINDILVSRDLHTVKVWVSFIAESDPEKTFQRLLRHSREIQTYLYRRFPVKKVPQIVWQFDKEPEATYRIEKILDDIHSTERENRDISESGANGTEDSDRFAS